jgi:3-oxoacyl-[acyl-carrier-protein] synthase II
MRKRVVVTGLGVVAPNGIGKEAFWETIRTGKSAVKKITRFDASSYPSQIAAEVSGFDPADFMDPKIARRSDASTQFFLASARMAVEDSGLNFQKENREMIGVFEGTSLGPVNWSLNQHQILLEKGFRRMNPLSLIGGMAGAASGHVSLEYGLNGPSLTFCTGSAAASIAIGYASRAIAHGELSIALAGGSEYPIIPTALAAFCLAKATSTNNQFPERACKPFDKHRDGFILGEGGAVLILEELTHALSRNAKIYAEIIGFGTTCDAYHVTNPEAEGKQIARAIRLALDEAKIEPEDVDYINAHGTGTLVNDKVETAALKRVFGAHAYKIPISSTKPITGHLLGASGAIEMVASILALQNRFVPSTINYEVSDPECDLDYVPNNGRDKELNIALSTNYSFGGKNSTLLVKRAS